MYQFNFSEVSEKDRGKIIQGSVVPRPIAWVSTANEAGIINLAPFSYFQMLSKSLVAISFLRLDGKMKHTPTNILKTKEAVIHIADQSLNAKLDLTSKMVDEDISEVILAKLTLTDSMIVKTKGIKEPKIRLEVKLEQHLELKNNDGIVDADLMILRVVYAHLAKDIYDIKTGYIDIIKLNPLTRLAGPNYGKVVLNNFKREFL